MNPPEYFQAYFWLLYNGSQLLVLPLLSRKLKMPSMTIASLSSVSRSAYFGLLAIATKPWLLYLAAGLNSLAGLQGILIRCAGGNQRECMQVILQVRIGSSASVERAGLRFFSDRDNLCHFSSHPGSPCFGYLHGRVGKRAGSKKI